MSQVIACEAAPALPGSYALHLVLAKAQPGIPVGRLGVFDFPAGDYLYLGSARGPGGLRARLAHHSRVAARPHWHLDFLRKPAALLGAWFTLAGGPLECAWSQALVRLPGASLPVPGFGAADCRLGCPAHLVVFTAGLPDGLLAIIRPSFNEPVYSILF